MALFGARYLSKGCIGRRSLQQIAGIHISSADMTEHIMSRTTFSLDSRRLIIDLDNVPSVNSHRRFSGSAGDKRQHNIRLGAAVGSATLIAGYFFSKKRRAESTVPIPSTPATGTNDTVTVSVNKIFSGTPAPGRNTVSAAANLENSGLPPSRRFNFIADVVEKAAPAVVYIELKERHPFGNRMVTTSNGSGFVVRSDGMIITNAHVVANKAKVDIRFYDGKQMEGVVIAVDPISDLAAIQVHCKDLPVVPMGQSANIRAGEWVVAMGSPLALNNTVTCGIVSSVQRKGKDLGIKNKDISYIQTDALINFGNSGGPLINLDGEVIGINTMKVTPGISFAIPSDFASTFIHKVDELLKRGDPKNRHWFGLGSDSTRRRFIGITMLTLNPELIMELKTRVPDFPDIDSGVLIHKIIVGSPAFNGGLRAGDIIVAINGKPAQSAADVYSLVESSISLNVMVYRGHLKKTFIVTSEDIS